MEFGVGVTDLRWHAQMLDERPAGLVNFWTPTPWKFKLKEGSRFAFMLKAPVRKIGGFGHFLRYEELEVAEAWDRWGPANGVRTHEELRARIVEFASKRSIMPPVSSNPTIGCIILADCVFLEEEDQFSPEDISLTFPGPIVKWKRFKGEFRLSAESALPPPSSPFRLVEPPDEDWQLLRRRKRLAQPLFRRDVIAAYSDLPPQKWTGLSRSAFGLGGADIAQ